MLLEAVAVAMCILVGAGFLSLINIGIVNIVERYIDWKRWKRDREHEYR